MEISTNTKHTLGVIACLVGVALALYLFLRSLYADNNNTYELLRKQKEESEKAMVEIIRITNAEKEALIASQKETQKKLDEEHDKYESLKNEIENKKKLRAKTIIEEHGNDPNALANLMVSYFNLNR